MTELDPRIRVCAVCGAVLEHTKGAFGEDQWLHLRNPDGHVVVPALPTEVHTNGACDMCSARFPRFELPAADFDIPPLAGQPTGTGSRGNWACCEGCATLIEANRWDRLVARAQAALERAQGAPLTPPVAAHLRQVYRRLRANVTGPVRPLQWPTPPAPTR